MTDTPTGEWYFRLSKGGKIHFSTDILIGTSLSTVRSSCGQERRTVECYFQPRNPLLLSPYLRGHICKRCFQQIEAIAVAEKMGES